MNYKTFNECTSPKKNNLLFRRLICMLFLSAFFIVPIKAETTKTRHDYSAASNTQQRKRVTGTISDASGEAIIGANVIEVGTNNGTITDSDGKFTLEVANDAQIRISYIGYHEQVVNVSGRSDIRVTLSEDTKALSEVVVVAYGEQKRSTLTNAQSSISSSTFEAQPVMRLDQALQGRAAGVQVTNATGAPGGDVRIRIRGANSVSGNNNPLYVVDGFVGGDFNTINPDDIADIQVLKDAAATAPYGSRGANGVIIVTTKKGNRGKANYSFSTRLSSSSIPKMYDVLSAADFAETANAYNTAIGVKPIFSSDQINAFKTNGGTDWQKEIYQSAFGEQYEFGVNGGNELATYYLSLGYQNQPGVVKNSFYNFYNIRSNINVNLSENASTYLNINGFIRNNQNTFMRAGTQNAVNQSIAWAPTTPVRDEQGNLIMSDPVSSIGYNPVAELFNRIALQKNYNVNIVGGLRYRIIEPLTFNVQYGINYGTSNYNNAGDKYVSGSGFAGRSTNTDLSLQNTNTLTYRQVFNDVHNLDLTGVAEFHKWTGEGFSAGISDPVYPSFLWHNLSFGQPNQPGASHTSSGMFSLFARANYSFAERYIVSATIRRDASSVFRNDYKAGYFPSMSLGWALQNEEFIKKMNFFDELKLRLSWGLTGNQAIGSYSTFSTYASVQATLNSQTGTPGIVIDRAENPNLKWETTEQKNIGLDFRLKPLSLYGTVDYYIKNTRDLLFWVGLPTYTGGGAVMKNIGEIQNKGWEITLGATPVALRDFSWNTELNFSSVENKIVKLTDEEDRLFHDTNVGWGLTPSSEFVLEVGKPMAGMWGMKYLGTWKPSEATEAAKYGAVPGDSKYEDVDKNYVIDDNDYQVIGYGLPKYTMGWNNTLNYKGLELNLLLQGVFGFDKMNLMQSAGLTSFGDIRFPTLAEILDRYVPGKNETSDIPAFSPTNKHFSQSSRFVSKGDFVRIKNLSLGYTIPKKVLNNIATMKVSASVTNLYTFTGYTGLDPEVSNIGSGSDAGQSIDYGGYPIPRTFTFGLTLTF